MTTTAEILRELPYFADLDQELLEDVCAKSERLSVPRGTQIIAEGTRSEEMYVIVSGQLEVTKKSPTRDVTLATLGAGEVVGEIALLDGAPRTASVIAISDAEVIRVPGSAFEELIGDARVVRRMFRTVTSRLRGIEETLRYEVRMAALGRMAAQLMHELNNPAAAVARSASRMSQIYNDLGDAATALANSGIDFGGRFEQPEPPDRMTALERSDLEDQIAELLENLDMADAWDLAPALVEEGWTAEWLAKATEGLEPDPAANLARWIGLRCLAGQVIKEVTVGVGRISELVRVVKDYSYLDQAPVQEIDPTAGIDDTLLLLKYKLRGIEVVTDYEPDLHKVEAPGRDLNQVWTNLIDNAAHAMEGNGRLTITARNSGDSVRVDVTDTGPGIDQDTLERIFDPFFTTKQPGEGTGLGLHTVHSIISKAGGQITATSSPEGTTFTVVLPRSGSPGPSGQAE